MNKVKPCASYRETRLYVKITDGMNPAGLVQTQTADITRIPELSSPDRERMREERITIMRPGFYNLSVKPHTAVREK